jgi:predicted nucleotidyltransferase
MKINERLQQNREEVLRLAHEHGASQVRVFGSVAKGEDTEASDLDLLVEMEELESIRAYDAAKASGDEAIPFEQAISEIIKS